MEKSFYILELIKNNDIDNAKKEIEDIKFSNKGLYYYYNGLCEYTEKEFLKAVLCYNKAIDYGIDNYIVYYNLGTAYLEINNYVKAEESFKKAIMLDKSFEKSYINLAYTYYQNKNYKKAYVVIKFAASIFDNEECYNAEKKLYKLIVKTE